MRQQRRSPSLTSMLRVLLLLLPMLLLQQRLLPMVAAAAAGGMRGRRGTKLGHAQRHVIAISKMTPICQQLAVICIRHAAHTAVERAVVGVRVMRATTQTGQTETDKVIDATHSDTDARHRCSVIRADR